MGETEHQSVSTGSDISGIGRQTTSYQKGNTKSIKNYSPVRKGNESILKEQINHMQPFHSVDLAASVRPSPHQGTFFRSQHSVPPGVGSKSNNVAITNKDNEDHILLYEKSNSSHISSGLSSHCQGETNSDVINTIDYKEKSCVNNEYIGMGSESLIEQVTSKNLADFHLKSDIHQHSITTTTNNDIKMAHSLKSFSRKNCKSETNSVLSCSNRGVTNRTNISSNPVNDRDIIADMFGPVSTTRTSILQGNETNKTIVSHNSNCISPVERVTDFGLSDHVNWDWNMCLAETGDNKSGSRYFSNSKRSSTEHSIGLGGVILDVSSDFPNSLGV